MNLFLCDIMNTFDGEDNNREEKLKEFFATLEKIVKNLGIDNISFSFISTGDMDFLMSYIKEIKKYMNSKIREGMHYSCNEIYDSDNIFPMEENSKVEQIKEIIKATRPKRIILADDSEMNQALVDLAVAKLWPDIELISFMPNHYNGPINSFVSPIKGIDGLIECSKNFQLSIEPQNKKHNNK